MIELETPQPQQQAPAPRIEEVETEGNRSRVEGTPLPVSVADSNTIEGSLIRSPDGTDTDDAAADWRFTTTTTRGAANVLTSS